MTKIRALTTAMILGLAGVATAQTEATPEAKAPARPDMPVTEAPKPKAAVPAAPLPRARICTAKPGNNYHRYGQQLKARLKGKIDVEVVDTRGSWENLELIDSEPRRCDAVIAQEDAYGLHHFERPKSNLTMHRTATLYPEYVHLLCHRSISAERLSQLDPEKHEIVVNEYGSGSYITWRLFRRLNPDHRKYKLVELSIDEAMLRIIDANRPACFFYVSGIGGHTLTTADETFGDQLKLLQVVDPKLHRPVGRDKRQIYRSAMIPNRSYKQLASEDIATQAVSAVFFTSPEWKARYPKASSQLATALLQLIADRRKQDL